MRTISSTSINRHGIVRSAPPSLVTSGRALRRGLTTPLLGCVLLLLLAAAPEGRAQAGTNKDTGSGEEAIPSARAIREEFCVLIEPKFRRARLARAIEGARLTHLVPAFEGNLEFEYYDRERFAAKKLTWEQYYQRSMKTADRILGTLRPRFI